MICAFLSEDPEHPAVKEQYQLLKFSLSCLCDAGIVCIIKDVFLGTGF